MSFLDDDIMAELSDFSSNSPVTSGSMCDSFVLTPVKRRASKLELDASMGIPRILQYLDFEGHIALVDVLTILTSGTVSLVQQRPLDILDRVVPYVANNDMKRTPEVPKLFVKLVSMLAFCDSHRSLIVNSSTLDILLQQYYVDGTLITHNEPYIRDVTELFIALTFNDDTRRVIGKTYIVELVVTYMKFLALSKGIQLAGCKLLHSLACDEGNTSKIRHWGGIKVIVSALDNHMEDGAIVLHGCGTLYCMISEIAHLASVSGFEPDAWSILSVLPEVMCSDTSSENICNQSLGVIKTLILSNECADDAQTEFWLRSVENRVVEAVVKCLLTNPADEVVAKAGVDILYTLFKSRQVCHHFISCSEVPSIKAVINALVTCMGEHVSGNPVANAIQSRGEEVINILSQELQVLMRSPSDGMAEKLVEAFIGAGLEDHVYESKSPSESSQNDYFDDEYSEDDEDDVIEEVEDDIVADDIPVQAPLHQGEEEKHVSQQVEHNNVPLPSPLDEIDDDQPFSDFMSDDDNEDSAAVVESPVDLVSDENESEAPVPVPILVQSKFQSRKPDMYIETKFSNGGGSNLNSSTSNSGVKSGVNNDDTQKKLSSQAKNDNINMVKSDTINTTARNDVTIVKNEVTAVNIATFKSNSSRISTSANTNTITANPKTDVVESKLSNSMQEDSLQLNKPEAPVKLSLPPPILITKQDDDHNMFAPLQVKVTPPAAMVQMKRFGLSPVNTPNSAGDTSPVESLTPMTDMRRQIKVRDSKIDDLKDTLANEKEQLCVLIERLANAESTNQTLQLQLESFEVINSQLEQELASSESMNRKLHEKLSGGSDTVDEDTKIIEGLRAELLTMQASNRTLEERITDIESSNAVYRASSESINANLTQQVTNMRESNRTLQDQLVDMELTNEELQSESAKVEKKNTKLVEQITEISEQYAKVEEELDATKTVCTSLQDKLVESESRNAMLRDTLEQSGLTQAHLQSELSRTESVKAQLQEQTALSSGSNAQLEEQVQHMQLELEQKNAILLGTQQIQSEQLSKISQLETLLHELQKQNEGLAEEKVALQANLQELQDQHESLAKEKGALESNFQEQQERNESLTTGKSTLETKLQELESQVDELEQGRTFSNQALENHQLETRDAIKELETLLASERETVSGLQASKEELENTIEEMTQLHNLKVSHLESKLQRTQSELTKAKSDGTELSEMLSAEKSKRSQVDAELVSIRIEKMRVDESVAEMEDALAQAKVVEAELKASKCSEAKLKSELKQTQMDLRGKIANIQEMAQNSAQLLLQVEAIRTVSMEHDREQMQQMEAERAEHARKVKAMRESHSAEMETLRSTMETEYKSVIRALINERQELKHALENNSEGNNNHYSAADTVQDFEQARATYFDICDHDGCLAFDKFGSWIRSNRISNLSDDLLAKTLDHNVIDSMNLSLFLRHVAVLKSGEAPENTRVEENHETNRQSQEEETETEVTCDATKVTALKKRKSSSTVVVPDVAKLWRRERGPLHQIFVMYASLSRIQDRKSRGFSSQQIMSFQGLIRMCSDFCIVPDLMNRTQVHALFREASETSDGGLTYDNWLIFLEYVATRNFKTYSENDTSDDVVLVMNFLQWMDASNGKERIQRRTRGSSIIPQFSTVRS